MNEDSAATNERFVVVVRVTEACRLGCRFCGYSRDIVRPRAEIDATLLDQFGRVLADYQQQTGRPVLVSWLGGEPFDWAPLTRLSHRFATEYGLALSITTNGVTLGLPETRELLLSYYSELTVSIDGIGLAHDDVRQSPGLFVKVRGHVQQLRRADPGNRLLRRVNTVLMRQNIAAFPALCDELSDWGVHEITFNALGGNDRPEFYPEHCLRPEQMAAFRKTFEVLRERLHGRGVRLSGAESYLNRLQAAADNRAIAIADCGPGDSFLFVDVQGRASPCSFTSTEYGIPISELDSAAALATLPQRFAMRRRRRTPWCDNCPATHVFQKFTTATPPVPFPDASLGEG